MGLMPELSIGLWNGWWFSLVYLLGNFVMYLICPEEIRKRVFTKAKLDFRGTVTLILGELIWYGVVVYALFVPIKFGTWYFWAGMALFIIGMMGYMVALVNYASASLDEPVTRGLYRFSRNPIYVSNYIVWFGVGLAAGSWVIIVVYALDVLISHMNILDEERFCAEKYGESYLRFKKRVPRYLGIPKGE